MNGRSSRLGPKLGGVAVAELALGLGLFLLAGVLVFVIAPLFAASDTDVADTRTAALQLIGGTVLAIGAFFTARTYGLNRTGQISERFTKAIDQLGADKLEIQLGGIYALEQIAKEPGSGHHPQIMEVLTAYVREHAPLPSEPGSPGDGAADDSGDTSARPQGRRPATDVQAVMKVLGRRNPAYDVRRLDLRRVDLRGLNLFGANLGAAILARARLEETSFERARLPGATLFRAHLDRTIFHQADLAGARLESASLVDAVLTGANLELANLDGAGLTRAVYDESTRWPAGFDPERRGARRHGAT